MKRLLVRWVVLLGLCAACGEAGSPPLPAAPATSAPHAQVPPPVETIPGKPVIVTGTDGKQRKLTEYDYDSVSANPDAKLGPAFQGEVHPILKSATSVELTARWKPTLQESKRKGIQLGIIDNAQAPEYSIPGPLVKLLTESKPSLERATYDAHALSAYLPERFEEVGQMWALDPVAAARPLAQFHPAVSLTFDTYHQPYGRRPCPPGAFAILRAVSEAYYEVDFRVHAEFILRDSQVVYTPACFIGRMLIDRASGTVPFFELSVPSERGVNLNILLTFRIPDDPTKLVTNIVFEKVEPMELRAGERALADGIAWSSALELAVAEERLKTPFYKFMDIAWVPLEDALESAQKVAKPILAAVLTSPLDDQSC